MTVHATTARRPPAGSQPPDLVIDVSPPTEHVFVTIRGELDISTEPALGSALRNALARSRHGIVLDLAGTTFCDCSGLNALLAARHHALTDGKIITIRAAGVQVQHLLNATGTGSLFAFPSHAPAMPQEEALSHEEDLRSEVVQLRRAMQTRPIIDQATGILMASFSLASEEAWHVLVTVSQNTNTKLRHIADQLAATTQGAALTDEVQQQLAAAIAAISTDGDPATGDRQSTKQDNHSGEAAS
ncbi:ANTAR domain-containing protein [Streptomyces sp. NPDC086787]|uniref:ANTAR domain-containing protein n=1 Tax=Streptomyces sp. NPDC086787 TaxID=3365759 RepID=UPI00381ECD0C